MAVPSAQRAPAAVVQGALARMRLDVRPGGPCRLARSVAERARRPQQGDLSAAAAHCAPPAKHRRGARAGRKNTSRRRGRATAGRIPRDLRGAPPSGGPCAGPAGRPPSSPRKPRCRLVVSRTGVVLPGWYGSHDAWDAWLFLVRRRPFPAAVRYRQLFRYVFGPGFFRFRWVFSGLAMHMARW